MRSECVHDARELIASRGRTTQAREHSQKSSLRQCILWHTAGGEGFALPQTCMTVTRGGNPMPLLVHGGHVLNSSYTALERADILIEADRISAVGQALAFAPDTHRLDATGCLVLPGLVNAHTHAHNNLFKGLGDNWTLEDLLNHGAALNGNRTPEDHYLSAALVPSRCSKMAVPRRTICLWRHPPRPLKAS